MYHYNDKEFVHTKDLAMYVIGGKYKIALIWALLQQPVLRLSEIHRLLPAINQRMIIRQLRELERDQIITRQVYPVVPPKVDYRLTEIGLSLRPIVEEICQWGDQYWATVEGASDSTLPDEST